MRKDWKTKSWKDFSSAAKTWFFIDIVLIVSIIAFSFCVPSPPSWVGIPIIITLLFGAYKLASSVGMLSDDDDDDDDDPQSLTR